MGKALAFVGVGVVGVLLGLAMGLRLGTVDHWEKVREWKQHIGDPQNYEPSPTEGVGWTEPPFPLRPHLEALVGEGELRHVDLVFPNVPGNREVTRYWMRKARESRGILEIIGEAGGEFSTAGVQPVHINVWFTDAAEDDVRELIAGVESFAEQKPE